MRPPVASVLLLSFFVIAAGCQAAGSGPKPATDPTQRLELDGFSILPPRGAGWVMVESRLFHPTDPRVTVKVYFANVKQLATATTSLHLLTAVVRTLDIEESEDRTQILQSIARGIAGAALDTCFGYQCVRYESTSEDRSQQFPGGQFMIGKHGFVVLHPDSPSLAINVEWVQYHTQDVTPLSAEALESQVDPFQRSLEFTNVRSAAPTPASPDFVAGSGAYTLGDYATTLEKWVPLARQGHGDAQAGIGDLYRWGRGVSQDHAEAANWYRQAAEQGHMGAQFSLGEAYAKGEGVAQDYAEALQWYRKAAEQGQAQAQFSLGEAYAKGEGVPQDYVLAHMWFSLAANQATGRDRETMVIARDGMATLLTPVELAEAERIALQWYRKAAEQGQVQAQYTLGWAYAKGEGVPQDYVLAHMWFSLAASRATGRDRETMVIARDGDWSCPGSVDGDRLSGQAAARCFFS